MNKKKKEQNAEVVTLVAAPREDEEDTITIPLLDIFRQLKKYFLPWLIVAVVLFGLVFGGCLITSGSSATPLTAMVGFTYDGIEEGLDPNGDEFDANTLKSLELIETTLEDLGMETTNADTIRSGITVSGVVSEETMNELTAYKSIFDANNSIEAAKQIMDVSYYPTRYEVQFTYAGSGMNRSQAADFLNTLLGNYKTYFMRTYGYSSALGDALTTVDYTSYDYAQALDVFSNTLSSLQNYVSTLSSQDETRFRSSVTGYTFSDLSEAIKTVRDVDYATLSSYVIQKNVTKDKDALATYYQYRIDTLNRSLTSAKEKLASITDSITNYQKDSMVVVAGDSTNSTISQPSEAYDDLIDQKTDAQSSVSSYQSQITDYQSRLDNLNSKATGSKKDQEKVDADMETVCSRINALVEDVNETADDYFENASYANAYNVVVPASGSVSGSVNNAISNMARPVLIVEIAWFVIYLVFAVVRAFMVSYRRNAIAAAKEEAEESKEASAEESAEEKKIEEKSE